jgi:hypothetical protein
MPGTSLLVENKNVIKDEYGGTNPTLNLTQQRTATTYSGKRIYILETKPHK